MKSRKECDNPVLVSFNKTIGMAEYYLSVKKDFPLEELSKLVLYLQEIKKDYQSMIKSFRISNSSVVNMENLFELITILCQESNENSKFLESSINVLQNHVDSIKVRS